jgi:hypothetical protein
MFEVFMAMTVKNAVFWDGMLRGTCKNRRFGGTYRLHHQGDRNRRATDDIVFLRSVLRLLFTANVVPSYPILVILMMEAILPSKTSVLTEDTRHNVPEDGILLVVRTLMDISEECIVSIFRVEYQSSKKAGYSRCRLLPAVARINSKKMLTKEEQWRCTPG